MARPWQKLLPVLIALSCALSETAIYGAGMESKAGIHVRAGIGDHSAKQKAVPEGSLLAQKKVRSRWSGGDNYADLSDSVYSTADTGGSTWQAQLEDQRNAALAAVDAKKRRVQQEAATEQAYLVQQAKAKSDAAIRAQAELQDWRRHERAVGEEAEIAAQRAFAIGQEAEIAAKRSFLISGGLQGDEWLRSQRPSRAEPEELASLHGHSSYDDRLDELGSEGLAQQRAPAELARRDVETAPQASSFIRREATKTEQAKPTTEVDDLVRTQWWGHRQPHKKSELVDENARFAAAVDQGPAFLDDAGARLDRNEGQGVYSLAGAVSNNDAVSNALANANWERDAPDLPLPGPPGYGRDGPGEMEKIRLLNEEAGTLYGQRKDTEGFDGMASAAAGGYSAPMKTNYAVPFDSTASSSDTSVGKQPQMNAKYAVPIDSTASFSDASVGKRYNQGLDHSSTFAPTVNSDDVIWNEEGQEGLGGSTVNADGSTTSDLTPDDVKKASQAGAAIGGVGDSSIGGSLADGDAGKGGRAMSAYMQANRAEHQESGTSGGASSSRPALASMQDQEVQAAMRLQNVQMTNEDVQAHEAHASDLKAHITNADILYEQSLHDENLKSRTPPKTAPYYLGTAKEWSGPSLRDTLPDDPRVRGGSLLEVGQTKSLTAYEKFAAKQASMASGNAKAAMLAAKVRKAEKVSTGSKAKARKVVQSRTKAKSLPKAKPVVAVSTAKAKVKSKPKPKAKPAVKAMTKAKPVVNTKTAAKLATGAKSKVKRAEKEKVKAKVAARARQAANAQARAKQAAQAKKKAAMLAKARSKAKALAKSRSQAKKTARKAKSKAKKTANRR